MKIEKVDDNQILWTLDKEDLARNQIHLTDFLTGTPKIRELFREAVLQAERDLGFHAEGTVLNCRLREWSEMGITFSIVKKEIIPENPCLLGEFASLDEVIDVSGLLSVEMELKNSLYKLEDSYLLMLQPKKKDEKQLAWCTVNLSEFTEIESISEKQQAFIREHGECIIGNEALQRLREMV